MVPPDLSSSVHLSVHHLAFRSHGFVSVSFCLRAQREAHAHVCGAFWAQGLGRAEIRTGLLEQPSVTKQRPDLGRKVDPRTMVLPMSLLRTAQNQPMHLGLLKVLTVDVGSWLGSGSWQVWRSPAIICALGVQRLFFRTTDVKETPLLSGKW